MKRSVLVFILFIHFSWAHEEVRQDLIGWHQKVGIKQAQQIKELEERQRIVGGAIAPINAHPYLAGLVVDVAGLSAPSICGGSLISSARVLTAAHCWFDGRFQAKSFTVVVGSPFIFHGGFRVFASHIGVHPGYDANTFANDIAILYIPVQVPLSEAIQPIALPSGSLLDKDYEGVWAKASGHGRYSDLTIPTSHAMARNVWLQVKPVQECRMYYGQLVLDSNICTAGTGGIGICQGDSGGPLTTNIQGQDVLIGVSSFVALDGCELGYPSAFTRVTSFVDWIRLHL